MKLPSAIAGIDQRVLGLAGLVLVGALVYGLYKAGKALADGVGGLADEPGSTGSTAADLVTGVPRLVYAGGLLALEKASGVLGLGRVELSGNVAIQGRGLVSLQKIITSGGRIELEAPTGLYVFTFEGSRYRLTGMTNPDGSRVAVRV